MVEFHGIDLTSSYRDWIKIGYALATEFGESGRSLFHRLSRFYPGYTPGETDRVYNYILRSNRGSIHLKTIFHIAKDYGLIVKELKQV